MTAKETSGDIREMTLAALRETPDALGEFRQAFLDCAAAFEQGEDSGALERLQGIVPHLSEFATFCVLVFESVGTCLPTACMAEFKQRCLTLEEYLSGLFGEVERGNYAEVADILRWDMIPITQEFGRLFTETSKALREPAPIQAVQAIA